MLPHSICSFSLPLSHALGYTHVYLGFLLYSILSPRVLNVDFVDEVRVIPAACPVANSVTQRSALIPLYPSSLELPNLFSPTPYPTPGKEYRVLVGVSYKSGACATLLVAARDINREGSEDRNSTGSDSKSGSDVPTPLLATPEVSGASESFHDLFHK